ncbi:MAG: DUF6492 family protein [Parachlamydiaceae bacterium]
MRYFFLFALIFFSSFVSLQASKQEKIVYPLENDPIDVVFVSHPKDKITLEYAIDGIKKNGANIRRVIVVSPQKITDKAEFFDEKRFPFKKEEIGLAIGRGNRQRAELFFMGMHRTESWYYQQCLKLYAPFVIDDISPNVLIVDADTIFMNPVTFLNESNGALFCTNSAKEAKPAYFRHAARLVPGYKRMKPKVYSVCHHMLFQRPILEDLFRTVEEYHEEEFWKAFCHCVNLKKNEGASEFEIYFSFALSHTDQVALRPLKWINHPDFRKRKQLQSEEYVYASFHDYLNKKKEYEKKRKDK